MKKIEIFAKAFKEVYTSSKRMFFWNYGLTLLQGICNAVPIIAIQIFFDNLLNLSDDHDSWYRILLSLVVYIFFRVAEQAIDATTNYNYEYYDLLSLKEMNFKTNRVVGHLSPIFFEKSINMDTIQKAYKGTGKIRSTVDSVLLLILYYCPMFGILCFYLFKANKFLPLLVPGLMVFIFVIERIRETEYVSLEDTVANDDRKILEYSELAAGLRYSVESGLGTFYRKITRLIEDTLLSKRQKSINCIQKENLVEISEKGVTALAHIAVFVVLSICVANGLVTIGTFAALLVSIEDLFSMIEGAIYQISNGISESLGKVQNYLFLQNGNPEVRTNPISIENDNCIIKMKDVSFTYPETDVPSLNNINLTIKAGEKIGIVGPNGAGKSTLLKLICGAYAPTSGMISQRKDCSYTIVPQNFGKYALNLRENILLGRECNEKELENLIGLMGLSGLTDNDSEILSKNFGRQDLSGGQWQRVAIARGLVKRGDFMLFDEPTSAISAIEENDINEKVFQNFTGNTFAVVTHRLSSLKYCNRILVLENGQIVGDGKHSELLRNCKIYRQMWEKQKTLMA